MLVIRKAQVDLLAGVAFSGVLDRLAAHFQRHYPNECRRAGDAQLRYLISTGAERAALHGFETEIEVGLYINLMIILGCDFDRDPQFPWAAAQLDDDGTEPRPRIDRLFRTTVEYLKTICGQNQHYMARALLRIRDFDPNAVPDVTGMDFRDYLQELLQQYFPEKSAFQGEEIVSALVEHALETAADHGLRGNAGSTVYVILAFMLGSGIDHDPMYPWVGRILADPSLPDEHERALLLHREGIAYLNEALLDS